MRSSTKRITYTLVVSLIVVFSTTFAILMTLERTDYRNYLQGEYDKSMYQLIDAVENIGANLSKVPVLGSREQNILAFSEIYKYSTIANDKLHSLPIAQQQLEGTSKFVTQVGDFCYVLGSKTSKGGQLSDSDIEQVERLKSESLNLENQLKAVQGDISQGKVQWGEIRKKVSGVLASNKGDNANDKFVDIQKQAVQYPSLIYDGPFSDNNLEVTPKINSMKEVSAKQAEDEVRKAVGTDRVSSIQRVNGGNTSIPVYEFNVSLKGRSDKQSKVNCQVTKHGGRVLSLLDNEKVNKGTIDMKMAIDIGKSYLSSLGYKDMISTYFLNYDNVGIISYIGTKDNVSIYPDMVKLKIALDKGNIVGIEAEKYLKSHDDNRNIGIPKITQDIARQRVGKRLNISSVKLAVVPTETNKEVLTYEFVGRYNGDEFVEYIDANTGYEVKVLQIRNTPNGKLTM